MFNPFKNYLQKKQKVYDEWINKNSSTLASLPIDRTCIIYLISERDDNNNKKRTLKERKELDLDI